jgi:hypothetical protein
MPLPLRLMRLPKLLLRLPTLPPRLTPLPLRPLTLPPRPLKLRLRRRSSNRLVDYCLEPIGSMTARAERTNVCPGFVFLGEA